MNMFENARSLEAMLAIEGMTQKKLADILGTSQSYVANKIRLLAFSAQAQKKILEYGLSERHARCILRLPDEEDRLSAIEKAGTMKMNVERCEALVDTVLDEMVRKKRSGINYAERIGHFEESLESALLLLRHSGIRAHMRRDECTENIYFSISIPR